MPDLSPITLGTAPDSWGVWFPDGTPVRWSIHPYWGAVLTR
jgi:hypothetical protein